MPVPITAVTLDLSDAASHPKHVVLTRKGSGTFQSDAPCLVESWTAVHRFLNLARDVTPLPPHPRQGDYPKQHRGIWTAVRRPPVTARSTGYDNVCQVQAALRFGTSFARRLARGMLANDLP